jgi:hypothetical protein
MSSLHWTARLLAAGLFLLSTQGRSAETAAKQDAKPAQRVSPYARYAREHAQSTTNKKARGKVKHSSKARKARR